jgi:hypothetical protein
MPGDRKTLSIGNEIASTRMSLRALEKALAGLAAQVRHKGPNGSAAVVKTRRKLTPTPAVSKPSAFTADTLAI